MVNINMILNRRLEALQRDLRYMSLALDSLRMFRMQTESFLRALTARHAHINFDLAGMTVRLEALEHNVSRLLGEHDLSYERPHYQDRLDEIAEDLADGRDVEFR